MPLPHCYNFAGVDLATKFGWVDGGSGMAAVVPAVDGLRGLVGTLTDAMATAESRMKALGASWTGPAATAAQNSLTRTADGASETAVVTTNGADRLLDYGHSFEWMRKQIAFVDPARFSLAQRAGDNISEAWQSLWGDGTDHVTISEMNADNDERANHALQKHQVNTERADTDFTTTAATAHPTGDGAGPQPGGVGGSASPTHVGQAGAAPAAGAGQIGAAPSSTTAAAGSSGHRVTPVAAPSGGGGGAGGGQARGGDTAPGGVPSGTGGGTGADRRDGADNGRGSDGTGGQGGGGSSPGTALPRTATAQAPGTTSSTGGPDYAQQAGTNAPPAVTDRATPWSGGAIPAPDDAAARRSGLGSSFGRDLIAGRLAAPGSGFGGSGGGGAGRGGGGSGGRPLGWGSEAGGRSAAGGGSEPGGRAPGAERGWTRSGAGETFAGRGTAGEPAATGRSAAGSGYGPMMGGGGAGAGQNGQEHRDRYLIPTDEAFEIDLHYTAPVLGPLPGERD